MLSFYMMLAIGFFPLWGLIFYSMYVIKHMDKYDKKKRHRIVNGFLHTIEFSSFTRLTVHGEENIPKEEDGGYLIVPNHQGKYDALAVLHAFDYPVSVLMESHRANMLCAKQVMSLIDGVPIDLNSPRQQLRVIRRMGERARDGEKFIVFPEGGYTDNRNTIQPFHDGCLHAAYIARCPILPVLLVDSYTSLNRKNIFRVSRPHLYILPAIPYETYKSMSRIELAEHIHGLLVAEMKKVLAERGETYVTYEEFLAKKQEKALRHAKHTNVEILVEPAASKSQMTTSPHVEICEPAPVKRAVMR